MSADDQLKDMSKNDLVREVRRLRSVLEEQMSAAPGVGTEVVVQGIVSVTDGQPIVSMRAGEAAWQLTPALARRHALLILDAAVEAERDAATIALLRTSGMDEQEAGGFLLLMREHRKDWFAEMTGGTV